MRKLILLLAFVSLSVSCRKSGNNGSSVRYEFTSDVAATYTIEYSSGSGVISKTTFQGLSWSETVIAEKKADVGNITTVRLVAYPPSSWINTTTSAHVNLKIFVNSSEKVNTDSLMTASNAGIGILSIYTF